MELFEFYNWKFTWINVIDIALVTIILFQLYRLLKGSLAFNMLIGLITIYIFWLIVRYFKMPLLEGILGEFTKVGIITILIVFQQEIRKFLLIIGHYFFLKMKKKKKKHDAIINMQYKWFIGNIAEIFLFYTYL